MSVVAMEANRQRQISPELELQRVVNCLMWRLRMKLKRNMCSKPLSHPSGSHGLFLFSVFELL